MLLLCGYNDISHASSNQCWLSPVALDLIASLRLPGQPDPYAFYIVGLREPDLYHQVLSNITIQLLRQNREALQNQEQYAELRAELLDYQKAAMTSAQSDEDHRDSDKISSLIQKVALRILNMFDPTKTVWIILDRADRCRFGSRNGQRKRLLKSMVHLVEKSRVRVRVLVVVNGHDWSVDEQADELGQTDPESVILDRVEQGLVEPW